MKSYLVLLPIFIFALLQGAFLPLNLVLLTIIFWSILRPLKETLWVAFFAGLLLDLTKGTPLGFSSFCLLVISYLLILYSHRFDPYHPLFLGVFVFLTSGFWTLIAARFFNWPPALILAGLALGVRLGLKIFSIEFIGNEKKLRF